VDALLILSGSLKAGRSLEQGFDLVQKSLPPPIKQEFFLVLQNQSLGMPFDKALKQMLDRVPSKDFRLFVTATLFQRETGGNIISLYDQIIQAVAERKKMRGKVDSMSVQGRYSAYVIATLPVALFAIMAVMNPEYVGVFWSVPWAKSLFVLAIVLEVTGIIVIRGILNRKVA
jgi:tight adherence protein B